jgi:hypothetical protein
MPCRSPTLCHAICNVALAPSFTSTYALCLRLDKPHHSGIEHTFLEVYPLHACRYSSSTFTLLYTSLGNQAATSDVTAFFATPYSQQPWLGLETPATTTTTTAVTPSSSNDSDDHDSRVPLR